MPLRTCARAAIAALALLSVRPLFAAEYVVPLLSKAPAMQGQVVPAEWGASAGFDGLAWEGQLERRRARAYVAATPTHLYLAIVSQLPDEGELTTRVDANTLKVVYDDSVEVWLDPTPGTPNGRTYQLLTNTKGFHAYDTHPRGNAAADPSWEGHWQIANGVHDGWWHCEIAVPLSDVAAGRTADQGAWGINLCRNWKEPWAFSSLSGTGYAPDNIRFVFTRDPAPAVRYEQRGDPLAGDVRSFLTLSNPGAAPITVKADVVLTRDRMPEENRHQTVTLGPGESRDVSMALRDDATKKFDLSVRVASPDGKIAYYDRSYRWQAAAPARWIASKRAAPPPIDFQFAYYPYANRMRLLTDVSGLPANAKLDAVTAVVRKKGGAVVRTVRLDKFQDGKQATAFDLPPLEGSYEIALTAAGQNVPKGATVKPFERTRYAWEHNPAGRTTKVYPPFTPLTVAGTTVSSVLRKHDLAPGGLWAQVLATGKPLLAAPMRYRAIRGGSEVTVAASPVRFITRQGNQVVAESGFRAGAVAASSRSTVDYDGTMRVDLTLSGGGATLDGLTLDIPLLDAAAPLMHAMGDGIRNTLYQPVPEGNGVVWTAEKVRSDDLPRGFCSYIYLGSAVRGLCWFAENDRGWGWDRKTPNLELVREGKTLTLRVHLIDQPTTLASPRTITFGLLAAPVKPRVSPWRYRWVRDNYNILGTDINWFALGDCGSVYPAGKDMYLWEMLKKGNHEHLSDVDVEKVVEYGMKYFAPYGAEYAQRFPPHVRYNLRSHYGAKMVFYYNRASYQAADEFQTFQDEWGLTDYRSAGPGNSVSEIKIVPSESYIDHALYWYGKSFDIGGNQGVYWDNWFFVGDYNTAMTAAYPQADGSVTPSTGIWGLRELEKRTFQYMNERGMLPFTMPHMTSTSILPMLSFATVQYDWEWKYSEGDVQYRFPREYVQLVTNGELAGVWPVLLGDHGPQESDPWTQRTFAGVCLVHELDPSGMVRPVWDPLLKPIFALLDDKSLQVYRYWDERPQPVAADNRDLPTIVYSVAGKEAVVVVTGYVDGDSTANLRIDARTLGFANGYRVVDAETGEALAPQRGGVSFPLKKHAVRELRILPATGTASR